MRSSLPIEQAAAARDGCPVSWVLRHDRRRCWDAGVIIRNDDDDDLSNRTCFFSEHWYRLGQWCSNDFFCCGCSGAVQVRLTYPQSLYHYTTSEGANGNWNLDTIKTITVANRDKGCPLRQWTVSFRHRSWNSNAKRAARASGVAGAGDWCRRLWSDAGPIPAPVLLGFVAAMFFVLLPAFLLARQLGEIWTKDRNETKK